MERERPAKAMLLGLAVGDALGVPVEFKSRTALASDPVTGMRAYGSHRQPAGTFSDDSSLSFCLAEALLPDFSADRLAENLVRWMQEGYWTADGKLFDIGNTTRAAICRIAAGCEPEIAGGMEEEDNGNGALMRILPLVFWNYGVAQADRFEMTRRVASFTHSHIRSVIACFYYLEFARWMIMNDDPFVAYRIARTEVSSFLEGEGINPLETGLFDRLLKEDIADVPETEIHSSGYVLHTLEASIWCLLTTHSYREAVLKAVNLGGDTDTTATVTGGLAGLLYGVTSIPEEWCQQLKRRSDIEGLARRIDNTYTF